MVKFVLDPALEKRGITLYRLAKIVGAEYGSLLRLRRGEALSVSFDLLDRICHALDCRPQDLFEFDPESNGSAKATKRPKSQRK